VAVAALAAIVAGPRVANWRHARAHAKIAPTPGSFRSSPAPTKPAIAAPVAAPAVAAPIAAPAIAAPVAAPAVVEAPGAPAGKAEAPMSPATAPATSAVNEKTCDTTLIRRAPWRLSPDACARAFDAEPRNATLALAVAHAAHVRGRTAEAAQWARRALSLDPKAAEAWVIIARAEAGSGRQEDARAAYQHYLEIAPRGWHRAEARAAVQRTR
jgi:hypothetical protein